MWARCAAPAYNGTVKGEIEGKKLNDDLSRQAAAFTMLVEGKV